ncbi:MAG: hypothetical protein NXI28_10260 [bacterium]|nr:hypothetical protein [bacterium]
MLHLFAPSFQVEGQVIHWAAYVDAFRVCELHLWQFGKVFSAVVQQIGQRHEFGNEVLVLSFQRSQQCNQVILRLPKIKAEFRNVFCSQFLVLLFIVGVGCRKQHCDLAMLEQRHLQHRHCKVTRSEIGRVDSIAQVRTRQLFCWM